MASFFEHAQPRSAEARVGRRSRRRPRERRGQAGAAGGGVAGVEERFGPYGGRFVPEVLMAALDELSAAWVEARDDDGFRAELDGAPARLRRPADAALPRPSASPSASAGASTSSARTWPTPAPTRSTTPSARRCSPGGWARRASSPRPGPASTASPRPRPARCSGWSASSTWAPRTCAARRRTSSGCGCWAPRSRRSRPARGPSRRRSAPRSATGSPTSADTHYIIGSAVGPAPYPALVRDLQRVIGDEAREQALAAEGALPERVIACVGGGSNAIGAFYAFLDDPVELIGVEAGGEGLDGTATAPRWLLGGPGCSTARCPRSSPTRTGRSSRRTRSRPASTTRAWAPSTLISATPAGPATRRSPTPRRCGRSASWPAWRGSCRRSSQPRHRLAAGRRSRGRGLRCPLLVRPRRQGHGRGHGASSMSSTAETSTANGVAQDRGGVRRRAVRGPGGADALPDGRLPRRGDRDRRGERLRRGRRGPGRAGRPVLRPARRRARDPRRGDPRARGRGRSRSGVLRTCERDRGAGCPSCRCVYANMVLARGAAGASRASWRTPARPGRSSPTCPRRRPARSRASADGRTGSHSSRWSRRRRRPSAAARICARGAGVRLPRLRHPHDRRARSAPRASRRAGRRGPSRMPACPSPWASASARPSRPREVGAVADGVIIGSRLVRAVAEADGASAAAAARRRVPARARAALGARG